MNVIESTQFRVTEIVVVTKGGPVDVTNMFEELNLYDSLFLPILSGNIIITDAVGLSKKLTYDGSEVIAITIKKDQDSEDLSYKKAFRIYSQSDRKNLNQTSEAYVLHFVADEFIFSAQQRINQSYETTYSKVAEKILTNYLKVPASKQGILEDSFGIRKIIVPNLQPLDAIDWCAKRAIDIKNAPDFLFFSNIVGYNFASLSKLLTKPSILDINFSPKNIEDNNNFYEMTSARSYEVITQNDVVDKITSGVNAGQFIGFDPLTRTMGSTPFTFDSHYSLIEHGNKNSTASEIHNKNKTSNFTTYDSRKVLSIFGAARKNSSYIKKYDPGSISKVETQELSIFQRKAILNNLIAKRLKITMPGNFSLSSGFNVNFRTQGFGMKTKGENEAEDLTVSGKYIITGTRHIIGLTRHVTIIEVASDSTNNPAQYVSNPLANKVLETY